MRKRNRVNNWLTALIVFITFSTDAKADNNENKAGVEAANYISTIYNKINFCRCNKLNPVVFETAYRGYINLRSAGKLSSEKDILSIADYSLSSNVPRLWIIDLKNNKVLENTYVAHGQGTGEEFANAFSNTENSHQSSLGFYATGDTYIGEHGLSLYLHGMDNNFNSAAYKRSVVLHGAAYVSEGFIRANQRLGRSWGCPAVAQELAPEIINTIKEGTCLFIYHPTQKYLSSSYWLNKNNKNMQQQMEQKQFELPSPEKPNADENKQLLSKQ